MDQSRIYYLLEQHLAGKLDPEEAKELSALVNSQATNELLEAIIHQLDEQKRVTPLSREEAVAAVTRIVSLDKRPATGSAGMHQAQLVGPRRKWAWVAAASVLLALTAGAYLLLYKDNRTPSLTTHPTPVPADLPPGKTGAILQLSDGRTIVLDSTSNGVLTNGVVKSDSALILHNADAQNNTIEHYTLTTPRARQQQLLLSDGSKIWLNAASSVRFPSAFAGKTREIEVTGEAYFEIAKDPSKPFIVKVKNAEIAVLGTSFNIMAYPDEEAITTTLLEGSVQVKESIQHTESSIQHTESSIQHAVILKPGQQAQIFISSQSSKSPKIQVQTADLEAVLAWKNGLQVFRKSSLATIMRQVERWYNVDVEFQSALADTITFTGQIPRGIRLSELLKIFETQHIHFKIDAENQQVMVIP